MLSFEELRALNAAFVDSGELREPASLNNVLVERYPFLGQMAPAGSEFWSNKLREFGHPDKHGWRKAFGVEFCEDLRSVLLAIGGEEALQAYRVYDIKEKYGTLRWDAGLHKGESIWESIWLTYVEEFYSDVSGHICMWCGGVDDVRETTGWIMPVCKHEKLWQEATPLARPKRNEPFCVWSHGGGPDISYKDMIVGADAPVVKELGLAEPLHASEIWDYVSE